MLRYLPGHLIGLLKPEPFDPHIQRSLDILDLLVGEQETDRIKAELRNYVDEIATTDSSPPTIGIFST